jgi:Domain of unknown function (DUF4403)
MSGIDYMRANWRIIGIGAAVAIAAFVAAGWALNWFSSGIDGKTPKLVAVPPLAPVTRSSRIIVPVAISVAAIGEAIENQAPREFSGRAEMPPLPIVSDLDMRWNVTRGAIAVTGAPDGLAMSAPLNGMLRASGTSGNRPGEGMGMPPMPPGLSNLMDNFFRGRGGVQGNTQGNTQGSQSQQQTDQRADIRGTVALVARPSLLPEWRIEPNLTSRVAIADASLSLFGMQISIPQEVKPLLERAINEQTAAAQAALRNNPLVELEARREWQKMCRSVSLRTNAPDAPDLWLETRPTRAFAAQPRIDREAVTLTMGVEAETRIVPKATKPDCPFPARLEVVNEPQKGLINIALPIDMPFAELNRQLEARLKGKTFPEDRRGAFTVTVRSVRLAASGDRLLISVGVRANEAKTWFGFGADAVVHVWGRPRLDAYSQILRMEDVTLDIESAAAFGALGAAARTAIPSLERALAEHATIDLSPLKDTARKNMDIAIAEFRNRSGGGVRIDADLVDLRLVGLEFDANTLRVIAEAQGTTSAVITRLPTQ